jgi:hypothetical protein
MRPTAVRSMAMVMSIGDIGGMYVAGATMSFTILFQSRTTLPKVTASLNENLLIESLVSWTWRVSNADEPSSNSMPVWALGLIHVSAGPSRSKSRIAGM